MEVLSPSTEPYDRGRKRLKYQALPDLRHFVLVAQDQHRAEAFNREGSGWHYELLPGPEAVLRLAAIGVESRLDEFYSAIPLLAMETGDLATQAMFASAQASGIAETRGLPSTPDSDAVVAELDVDKCKAAIVGLVGTPAMKQSNPVLPERLQDRLDVVLDTWSLDLHFSRELRRAMPRQPGIRAEP